MKNSSCRHAADNDKIEQVWDLLTAKFDSLRPKKIEVVAKKVVTTSNDSDSSEWEDSDDDDDVETTGTSQNKSKKRELSDNVKSFKKLKTLYAMLLLNRAKRRKISR